MKNDSSLFQTKVHIPPLPVDLVPRSRIIEWLNRRRERQLTLISGPAGYGKSTIAKCWTQSLDCPRAWVSLDEHDDDLITFLSYFLAAIQTIFPDVGTGTQDLLNATPSAPLSVISRSLINELVQIETPFVLVLDDYHKIRTSAIHELLTELLQYPPPSLRLVLCTRNDPPLPLVQLRAQGRMNEIRTQDLRFTRDETKQLLHAMLGMQIDDTILTSLEAQTEGWVTGLRLAALALRHRVGLDRTQGKLSAENSYIAEYLVAEILAQQTEVYADCMLKLSILERFCAGLCEAVCFEAAASDRHSEAIEGGRLLRWMQAANLFVISLDDQQQWFRFHHLFRDFLRGELARKHDAENITTLHQRASRWLAENNLFDEAQNHALAAGEIDQAVQLAARQRYPLMNGVNWQQLEQLLRKFSPDVIERYPELLILKAWLLYHSGRNIELAAVLTRIEATLAQTSLGPEAVSFLEGELCAMRSLLLYFALDAKDSIAQARRAIETTPRELWISRIQARMVLAGALQMTGDLEGAYAVFPEGLQAEDVQSKVFKATLLAAANHVYWIAADLLTLTQAASQCIALCQDTRAPEIMKSGQFHLGCVSYSQNDLSAAEELFTAVVEYPHLNYGSIYLYAACGLAQTLQVQGRAAEARSAIGAACTFFQETANTALLPIALAFQAELHLQQGQLVAASQWAAWFDRIPPLQPIFGTFSPHLTLVKIWLTENTATSRGRAASLLAEFREFVESIHNTRFLIEALALEALYHETDGETQVALDTLEQAIILAQPGGFIRLFVDLGPQMIRLLQQLHRSSVAQPYIGRILTAVRETPASVSRSTSLAEPLTDRELDVLTLLGQRLSYKEIAEQLFISPVTVKSHAIKVYQKLEVDGRHQAVEKAVDLGLLSRQ